MVFLCLKGVCDFRFWWVILVSVCSGVGLPILVFSGWFGQLGCFDDLMLGCSAEFDLLALDWMVLYCSGIRMLVVFVY